MCSHFRGDAVTPMAAGERPLCDIVFLCTERELTRERAGMWEALQGKARVRTLPGWFGHAAEIMEWWRQSPQAEAPILLWPDPDRGTLPAGLAECAALTACWHIDSFSATQWRAEHARLFDLTFVFHPGSVERFRALGVPDVRMIPHAVRRQFYAGESEPRTLDVAFVGSLVGAYTYRRVCLAALSAMGCSLNDYRRSYEYPELAATYRAARIGVNVPQDPYLRDANLRCFEIMAAGALLLTPLNSELRELGFLPGRHYLEFASPADLCDQVRRMQRSEAARAGIANAARWKVLAEFTYDETAAAMLQAFESKNADPDRHACRPGRRAAQRLYLRHHSRRGQPVAALAYLRDLAAARVASLGDARDALLAIARAARSRVRR